MVQCPSGTYGDAPWAASVAPPVRAGIRRAPPVRAGTNVATRNPCRRCMERAIWGQRAGTATGCGAGGGGGGFAPMPPLLVLIVAERSSHDAGAQVGVPARPALRV